MVEKEKTVLTDRKDFEKVLAENKTDFIICQKGKGHYQIVGYHTIMTGEGDTTIVLELGKKKNGELGMFEKEAEEYTERKYFQYGMNSKDYKKCYQDGAETTLRKVVKYFSSIVLDENCGGYFSRLLESEEELQKLAKELENV